MNKDYNTISIVKYAGAYVAFMIGSGFATGQEIMQFFTSYGFWSLGTVAICMILFAWIGSTIMVVAYDKKGEEYKEPYKHFCGKYLGTFFEYFIPLFLFAILVIMISGAGATFNEYYGLNYYVGCLIMAVLVLIAFLLGLNKLVDIVGLIGPVIIIFSLLVGLIVVFKNFSGITESTTVMKSIDVPSSGTNWAVSGLLYAAYPLVGSVPFFTALGTSAERRKDVLYGGVVGGVSLMVATLVMNFALLSRIEEVYTKAVPTLYIANLISPIIGTIFFVVLLLGIFSTAAPMMWTVCNKLAKEGTKKSKIIASILIVIAFFCGLLPFGTLVGTIYPFTGYLGILLFICILYKQIKDKKDIKESKVGKTV